MKKFFVVLLSFVCLMSFTSCDPKISPEQQAKLVVEAQQVIGTVMSSDKYADKFNSSYSEEGNSFKTSTILKEAITLDNGIKLEKFVMEESGSETSFKGSMTVVWGSKIDSKKHELKLSASGDPRTEVIDQSAKLDGHSVDITL